MKVFVLRHEKRASKVSYDSPLLEIGEERAAGPLVKTLQDLGVGVVYCSPFLRTVQTVAPFCKEMGIEARVEWGIAEFLSCRQHKVPDPAPPPPIGLCPYDMTYQSVVPREDVKYLETEPILEARVGKFLKWLVREEHDRPVLICTHMHVCNAIRKWGSPDHTLNAFHPMGTVVEVDLPPSRVPRPVAAKTFKPKGRLAL
eukprot:Sspe_Gene.103208::Locus_79031_Transcript_1_1_Confidence_1.000_Length_794::g.103208::m.103208